jgi:hypothetical protein
MLKSMKKPDPKKLGKAKTVVAYEKKPMPSSAAPKSISKADAEANLGRMRQSFEGYQDEVEGEKTFGPEYKNLGLKPYKYKSMDLDGKNVQEKRGYRVKEYDEDPDSPYKEEVELADPNNPDNKTIRVYRTGRMKDIELEPGQQRKGQQRSPRGEAATVYEETIKERTERLKAQKAAKAKAMIEKYAPIQKKAKEEYEAKKAQEKAGGNK